FTPTGTQPGHSAPMEIGAAQFPLCPIPSHIKCFDCQGNHYKHDCPHAKGKGHMSFEEMQAFFYDRQINEMKAQGKEFSQ
ncbi:hypothetical protein M404DRAFT_156298, partial [Pisolithus tinctorius Marx 270]